MRWVQLEALTTGEASDALCEAFLELGADGTAVAAWEVAWALHAGTASADDPRRRVVDPARRSVTTCSSVPLALVAVAVPCPGSATSRSKTT